jgi:hypothetical protein
MRLLYFIAKRDCQRLRIVTASNHTTQVLLRPEQEVLTPTICAIQRSVPESCWNRTK